MVFLTIWLTSHQLACLLTTQSCPETANTSKRVRFRPESASEMIVPSPASHDQGATCPEQINMEQPYTPIYSNARQVISRRIHVRYALSLPRRQTSDKPTVVFAVVRRRVRACVRVHALHLRLIRVHEQLQWLKPSV